MFLSRVMVPAFPTDWGWMAAGILGLMCGITLGWWGRGRGSRPRQCAIAASLERADHWAQDLSHGSASYVLEQLATLSLPVVVTTGSNDQVVAANGPFEQLTGWTLPDMRGQTLTALGLWLDPGECDRLGATLRSAQRCYNVRMRLGTRLGTPRVGLVSAEMLTSRHHTWVVWSIEDITAQSQSLNRLGLNQDRYRQTFENSPNPILTLGRDRTICHWNAACESTFGYSITAVLGQPLDQLVVAIRTPESWGDHAPESTTSGPGEPVAASPPLAPPPSTPGHPKPPAASICGMDHGEPFPDQTAPGSETASIPLAAVVNAAFRGEVLSGITLTYRCADGSEQYMLARFYPLFGEPGQPAMIAIANTNITDLKATQTALQISQERYAIATAAARIGVWDCNVPFQMVYIDAALNHLLGYDPVDMQLPLEQWLQRIHPEDRDQVNAVTAASVASAQPTFEVEHRFVCANGQSLWFLARGRILRNDQGQVVRILGTSTDMTERKQAELALRQSEATNRALIAAIPDRLVGLRADGTFLDVNTGDPLATSLPLAQSPAIPMDRPAARRHDRGLDPATVAAGSAAPAPVSALPPPLAASRLIPPPGSPPAASPASSPEPLPHHTPTWLTIHHVLTPTQAQACLIQIQQSLQNQAVQMYEYDYEQDGKVYTDEVRIAPLDGERTLAILRDVTTRKQQERGLRQQLHLERSLLQAIQAIRSPLALEEVFPAAVDEMSSVLDIDRATVVRLDEARGHWVHVADYRRDLRWPSALNLEFPDLDNSLASQLKEFEIVEVPDFSQVDDPVNTQVRHLFPGTWILVPIRVGDRLWGSLSLNRRDPNRVWKTVERELAVTIAQQLAIAIQQGELYEQLRTANQRLAQLATTDELTQVANRRSFEQVLHQEWRRMARAQLSLSLIMLDIDYFKQYNDTYGHLAGDRCLVAVAQTIAQAANRPGDLVARYGGEEFAVILPETTLENATYLAETIRQAILDVHLPHEVSPLGCITISLGVACTRPQGDPQPELLIAAADAALYRAKAHGRNTCQATSL